MQEYTIEYRRTMTVETDDELTAADLLGIAEESLFDDGALWNVVIGGTTYPIGRLDSERLADALLGGED